MWEIKSSKARRAKSHRDDVKAFAQMMIDNHGESTAKVKAAADAASITVPPPVLDPEQQRMLDEIKAADAARIDAVYIRNQQRSEERRVGKERVTPCRSRWSQYHSQKKTYNNKRNVIHT